MVPTQHPSMSASTSSAAQRRANQRNAKRSTGPTTESGKARSSRNAITHGMYCSDLLLPGESQRAMLALRLGYHVDLRATDAIEFAIIERAVIAQWKLRRAQAAEADLHGMWAERMAKQAQREIDKIRKELDGLYYDDAEDERTTKATAQAKIDKWSVIQPDAIPAPITLAADLRGEAWLERLSRQEHRLENHFYKALRELRMHRKDKRAKRDDDDAIPYVDIAQMTDELLTCEDDDTEDDETDDEAGDDEAEDDEAEEGDPSSDDTGSAMPQHAPSIANVQNEANLPALDVSVGNAGGCEQVSRIDPVAPTVAGSGRQDVPREDQLGSGGRSDLSPATAAPARSGSSIGSTVIHP